MSDLFGFASRDISSPPQGNGDFPSTQLTKLKNLKPRANRQHQTAE
jgi:hypothetical protein